MNLITNGRHIPYNPKLKKRSQELRKNMTQPEKKLWFNFLKSHPAKFLRQKPLDNYIVDFYSASHKLVIEIDGDTHFTDEQKIYDKERTAILQGYQLDVLRFTNNEIMKNFEAVCEKIQNILQKSPHPYHRCNILPEASPLPKGGE